MVRRITDKKGYDKVRNLVIEYYHWLEQKNFDGISPDYIKEKHDEIMLKAIKIFGDELRKGFDPESILLGMIYQYETEFLID